jgi:hypothetical protein
MFLSAIMEVLLQKKAVKIYTKLKNLKVFSKNFKKKLTFKFADGILLMQSQKRLRK